MHVITVIPLERRGHNGSLTYYTSTECAIGSIVRITIRGRESSGLVVNNEPVSQKKTALKSASFALKKLPADPIKGRIPRCITILASKLQDTYPYSINSIIFSLLPTGVDKGDLKYPETIDQTINKASNYHEQILIDNTNDRYTRYQSQIRTAFAQSGSVLLVVPTNADIPRSKALLQNGIQKRVFTIGSHDTPSKRRSTWQLIHTNKQPVLVITTPSYAYLERYDTKHIIIEKASHSNFKMRSRPFIDHVFALRTLAKCTNRSCTIGDTLLRTEEEFTSRNGIHTNFCDTPKRLLFDSTVHVIQAPKVKEIDKFQHFFSETVEKIMSNLHKNDNVFFYAPRRGLAPVITCADCGSIARCPQSGNPYSLIRTFKNNLEQRWFIDGYTGKRIRAYDTCIECGSWRLRERGVGIQQLEDVIPEYFPKIPILVFDATTASTPKKANDLAKKMHDSKGHIILGTSIALPYLPNNIKISCVTSLESATSIPSWRADEMLFRLILELREKTKSQVLLQARHEPSPIIEHAKMGTIEKFYTEELQLRKQMHYPPYSVLVLLSWKNYDKDEKKALIEKLLQEQKPQFYTNQAQNKENTTYHALLRIPYKEWPNKKVNDALRSLPPDITIQINPDRII